MAGKRLLRSWACGVAAVTVAALAAWGVTSADAEPRSCDGTAFLTWRAAGDDRHTLSIIDVESRSRTNVAALDFHVNAMGYSADDDRLYGLSHSRDGAKFPDAPHLISIDSRAVVTDTGPVRPGGFDKDALGGAYAGDIVAGNLVVLSKTRVTSIDIDERRVVKQVELDEPTAQLEIGDITAAPGSDLLYGLSTSDSAVVSIDPATGGVTRTPVADLPRGSLAGAIFGDADRRLHAVVNGVDGKAVMYRIAVPDDGSTPLRAVAEARWPVLTSADAAFCPAIAPARPQPSQPSSPSSSGSQPSQPSSPSSSGSRPASSPAASKGTPPSPEPAPEPAGPRSSAPAPAASGSAAPQQSRPPNRPEPSESPGRPPGGAVASQEAESETPRRWIAVGAVVIGMAGAAGVKAAANRKK